MKWSRELRIARRSLRTAMRAASAMAAANRAPIRPPHPGLVDIANFGSNPGRLSMLAYLPTDPPARHAPLIVLLHGCGQTAGAFLRSSGWIAVAERLRIPLVLPEQSGDNNQGRCFNWFRPTHTSHDQGEALSIRQMVAAATQRFALDPGRVFVAGLSAGGAMAAALLAAYPDVFAGGAVVAGLPVGAASNVSEALRRMAEAGPARSPADWAAEVRRAAPVGYSGPWPRLCIWHGDADRVVDPANARPLAAQWSALHGLAQEPTESVDLLGLRRDRWKLRERPVVELWQLPELGHAWPPEAATSLADFWDLTQD
jgi:poly(hydroxyalkanoate) depolymerase family esterase